MLKKAKALLKVAAIVATVILFLAMAAVLFGAYASVKADEWWATASESEVGEAQEKPDPAIVRWLGL